MEFGSLRLHVDLVLLKHCCYMTLTLRLTTYIHFSTPLVDSKYKWPSMYLKGLLLRKGRIASLRYDYCDKLSSQVNVSRNTHLSKMVYYELHNLTIDLFSYSPHRLATCPFVINKPIK